MQLRWIFLIYLALQCVWIKNLEAQWQNTNPVWEYEDETPQIPADVRLKLHNVEMAYSIAGEYHNKQFLSEYLRREGENAAFATRWNAQLVPRWVAFNDYLDRYKRAVWTDAGSVSANTKVINVEVVELGGQTLMVLENFVEVAKGLTFYLEDDTVVRKWEIFIRRLEYLEDAIKELNKK